MPNTFSGLKNQSDSRPSADYISRFEKSHSYNHVESAGRSFAVDSIRKHVLVYGVLGRLN